jgi:hypothetical protein
VSSLQTVNWFSERRGATRVPPGCARSARDRPVQRGQRPAGRGDPARPLRSGSGSSGAPRPSPRVAGRRRGPGTAWAVHQLAPASIVLAAGLGAAGQKRLCAHRGIIGTVPRGRMRRAPADVEDLTARIGVGLAIGAVGTSDRGAVGQEIRHRSIARSTVAISTSHSTAWRPSDTHPFEAQRLSGQLGPVEPRSPRMRGTRGNQAAARAHRALADGLGRRRAPARSGRRA